LFKILRVVIVEPVRSDAWCRDVVT